MILKIVKYPDPILSRPGEPITEFNDELRKLIADMFETMYAEQGIGLAAPQVGVALRMFVIDLSVGKRSGELLTIINPEFVTRDGMQLEEEGCLSVPGFNATIARPAHIVVRGLNRDGRDITIDGDGLLARALQHEMDHLDGMLFIDRLRGLRRDLMLRKIRRLQRTGRW